MQASNTIHSIAIGSLVGHPKNPNIMSKSALVCFPSGEVGQIGRLS